MDMTSETYPHGLLDDLLWVQQLCLAILTLLWCLTNPEPNHQILNPEPNHPIL